MWICVLPESIGERSYDSHPEWQGAAWPKGYSGQWCVPCGYVEWGEDVYEAAKREMLEETGLHIELSSLYTVISLYGEPYVCTEFYNPEQQSVMIWFLVKETGGELRAGDDIDQVGYFSCEELPQIAFPAHEIVIRKLLEEQLLC